jgi:hypothetical protein
VFSAIELQEAMPAMLIYLEREEAPSSYEPLSTRMDHEFEVTNLSVTDMVISGHWQRRRLDLHPPPPPPDIQEENRKS